MRSPTLVLVRESRESQPEEPGWWLASDGLWYPPERSPRLRASKSIFQPADKPPALTLFAVCAVSLAASCLFFGWDLSEVDANYQPADNPVPVTSSRAVLAVLVVLGVVVVCSWLTPRGWVWIAGTATLSVEAWFLWRAYSGRTVGANMAGVGALFMLPPLIAGTFGPAYVVSLVKQRQNAAR
jgi:hypothetical protein